jgi:hypothetical protein
MTADVEAAASMPPAASHDDEAFTLSDAGPAGTTREAWSIGDDTAADQPGEAPAPPTRTALPRALVVTAGLLTLIAVGALFSLTSEPSLPADAAGSGEAAEAPASGRAGSGSGALNAAKPTPENKPTARPERPTTAPASATRTAPDADSVSAPTLPIADAIQEAGTPEAAAPAPDFAALTQEGQSALKRGNLPDALLAFRAATALRPRSAEAFLGIAQAQAGSEQTADAIKSFETAVALKPNLVTAWSGLAHLRQTSGNRDGAIDAYRRVVAISPDSREAQIAREVLDELSATAP